MNQPAWSVLNKRRRALLVLALMLGAWLMALRNPLLLLVHVRTNVDGVFTAYVRTINSLNYFDDGFVRRGAAGTIMHLGGGGSDVASLVMFCVLATTAAILAYVLLLRRVLRHDGVALWWPALVACLSPQLFPGWGTDSGRVDMAVVAAIGFAVLAIDRDRPVAAATSLCLGLLFHETSIIFGLPLITAVVLHRHSRAVYDRSTVIQVVRTIVPTLAGVFVILAAHASFSAGPTDLVATMLSSSQADESAAFLTIAGARGIRASLCQAYSTGTAFLYVGVALAMLAAAFAVMRYRPREIGLFLLASILPFLAISCVAIDFGRWLKFAWSNAWMLSVVLAIDEPSRFAFTWRRYGAGIACFIVLLLLRPTGVDTPSRVVANWAQHGRGYYLRRLDKCDPGWREAVSTGDIRRR